MGKRICNLKLKCMIKKKIGILGMLLLTFCQIVLARNTDNNPDAIIGTWLNSSGRGQIEIYKEGNKYYGKLVWLKDPNDEKGQPRVDTNNPNNALKNKPLLGLVILRDFKHNGSEWNGGRIYDPQNGKDYKCWMKLKDSKTLSVRGYIGVSLLGRTEIWTRIN